MSKNKKDLIDIVAERADISKATAEEALNAMTDFITETLASGGKVSILRWGSWETSFRAARVGRNPRTGDEIKIPASRIPKFKAGKILKDAVNSE